MPRYVPKTYNNRRLLRILINTVITIIVSIIVLFLALFFILRNYVVDGVLEIPWLVEEEVASTQSSSIDNQYIL